MNNFLKKRKIVVEYNNWDDNELMKAIPLSLKELVFYQSLGALRRRNFKQFSDAKSKRQKYNPPEKIYMRRSELFSLKQEVKPLGKYVEKLENLALEADIGPEIKRDLFISEMNEELHMYLQIEQPITYNEALRKARVKDAVGQEKQH